MTDQKEHTFKAYSDKVRLTTLFTLLTLFGLAGEGCSEIKFLGQSVKEIKEINAPTPTKYSAGGLTLLTEGEGYKVGSPYQINGQWYYPQEDYNYVEEGIASWYGPGFHAKRTANGAVFDQESITAAHRTLPMPSLVRVTNLENGLSLVVKINDRGPFARNRILDLSHKSATILKMDQKGTALVRVEILADESRKLAELLGNRNNNPSNKSLEKEIQQAADPKAAPTGGVSRQTITPLVGVSDKSSAASTNLSQSPLPKLPERQDSLARLGNLESTVQQQAITAGSNQIFIQAGAFALYENAYKMKVMLDGEGLATIIEQYNTATRPLFRVKVGPINDSSKVEGILDRLEALGFADAHIAAKDKLK